MVRNLMGMLIVAVLLPFMIVALILMLVIGIADDLATKCIRSPERGGDSGVERKI